MEEHSALIAGATGLIGNSLLQQMLEDPYYHVVYIITRRKTGLQHDKLKEIIVDFDNLAEGDIPSVDDIFCCLGTTMKKAGSKGAFRKVDYFYPIRLAQLSRAKGGRQFVLVSAMGADRKSLFFYNKVKGEVEEAIARSGFITTHILRPSLLLGSRREKRTGERVGQSVMTKVSPLMVGKLKRYRPIEGDAVAKAMLNVARKELVGPFIFDSDKIQVLAAMK